MRIVQLAWQWWWSEPIWARFLQCWLVWSLVAVVISGEMTSGKRT